VKVLRVVLVLVRVVPVARVVVGLVVVEYHTAVEVSDVDSVVVVNVVVSIVEVAIVVVGEVVV
jgi:hypothetical protein